MRWPDTSKWWLHPATAALLIVQILVLFLTMVGWPGTISFCEAGESTIECVRAWQTIIAAALAFGAAAWTVKAMKDQIAVAAKQFDVLAGDALPDFALDWATDVTATEGQLNTARLWVTNRNRRRLELLRITVVRPQGLQIDGIFDTPDVLAHDAALGELDDPPDHRTRAMRYQIQGTPPGSAAEPVGFWIELFEPRETRRTNAKEKVHVKVAFTLHGADLTTREQTVIGLIPRFRMERVV